MSVSQIGGQILQAHSDDTICNKSLNKDRKAHSVVTIKTSVQRVTTLRALCSWENGSLLQMELTLRAYKILHHRFVTHSNQINTKETR